jgi:hypothetical protein
VFPFASSDTWRHIWTLYAASILLFIALGILVYRLGLLHGAGTASIPARTSELSPAALEQRLSDAQRDVGTTAGDPQNTIILPAYTLLDASLRYHYKRLRFQVNATNLADKTYVPVCESVNYCNYGYKRDVIGSVHYRWSSWKNIFQ